MISTLPLVLVSLLAPQDAAPVSPSLREALGAARFLEASAIKTDAGLAWPADPKDPKSVSLDLYAGSAGVVLFFLEAHHLTGRAEFRERALAGADHLLASLDTLTSPEEQGLYTGLAGVGYTLATVYDATQEEKYRAGARTCARRLCERGQPAGAGVAWSDTNDIIAGSAGIGLFLLDAAHRLDEPRCREVAVSAGKRLLEVSVEDGGQRKWPMNPTFPRLMPNFSHGTAGVAYFLATLYEETKEQAFLDAAISGAKYLQSVAKTDRNTCVVFHDEPDGKDLYYLSWCHGPAGTARLFYRLAHVTGDQRWMEWVTRCAQGIEQSGIPDQLTPGFWNNVSQCCGSAGVAEFFLALHRLTKEARYLQFARHVTDQITSKATHDGNASLWVQAEHRVKPELLVAQTGYMQGAAGIGLWYLHLEEFERGKTALVKLPDSPF